MTEKLIVERSADGGLLVQLITSVGKNGELVIAKQLPPGPGLAQTPLLELQADLMAEALVLLQSTLAAARLVARRNPKAP